MEPSYLESGIIDILNNYITDSNIPSPLDTLMLPFYQFIDNVSGSFERFLVSAKVELSSYFTVSSESVFRRLCLLIFPFFRGGWKRKFVVEELVNKSENDEMKKEFDDNKFIPFKEKVRKQLSMSLGSGDIRKLVNLERIPKGVEVIAQYNIQARDRHQISAVKGETLYLQEDPSQLVSGTWALVHKF
jgi:hypothetical protein